MGRYLTDVADFGNAAPLAGALEYEDEEGNVIALAMLQGFIGNQGDAWTYTQDYLKRFLDDCLQQPEMVREAGENVHTLYLLSATTLGRRTGELHRALALTTGDPAFDPEPITAADLETWIAQIRGEAITALERLEQAQWRLAEPARSLAGLLLGAREQLMARFDQLETGGSLPMKTRFHGDYHLGQVLVSKDDIIIIDFEGEPSRSLEERRHKNSPLRDVVGMLRSINYATHAALRQATADGTTQWEALAPYALGWEHQVRAAFLEGYAAAVQDCVSYPADPKQLQMFLDLFTLEKACYELCYELDNRPDWVAIPLGGLCELLSLETKDVPR